MFIRPRSSSKHMYIMEPNTVTVVTTRERLCVLWTSGHLDVFVDCFGVLFSFANLTLCPSNSTSNPCTDNRRVVEYTTSEGKQKEHLKQKVSSATHWTESTTNPSCCSKPEQELHVQTLQMTTYPLTVLQCSTLHIFTKIFSREQPLLIKIPVPVFFDVGYKTTNSICSATTPSSQG